MYHTCYHACNHHIGMFGREWLSLCLNTVPCITPKLTKIIEGGLTIGCLLYVLLPTPLGCKRFFYIH